MDEKEDNEQNQDEDAENEFKEMKNEFLKNLILSDHFSEKSLLDIYIAEHMPISPRKSLSLFDKASLEKSKLDSPKKSNRNHTFQKRQYEHILCSMENKLPNEVEDLEDLRDQQRTKPFDSFIVIVGNIDDAQILGNLIFHLRRDYFQIRPIIIMHPDLPKQLLIPQIFSFPEVYYCKGSAEVEDDLEKWNDKTGTFVLVSEWVQQLKKSTETKMCYGNIKQIYHSMDKSTQNRVVLVSGKNFQFRKLKKGGTPKQRLTALKKKEAKTLYDKEYLAGNIISYDLLNYWLSKNQFRKKI